MPLRSSSPPYDVVDSETIPQSPHASMPAESPDDIQSKIGRWLTLEILSGRRRQFVGQHRLKGASQSPVCISKVDFGEADAFVVCQQCMTEAKPFKLVRVSG